MMLNEQEKNIERYLNNEMDDSERRAFESAMAKNAELANQVAFQKDLMQFFKERNPALENQLSDLGEEFFKDTTSIPKKNNKIFYWVLIVIGVLLITAVGGFFYINNSNRLQPDTSSTVIDAEKAINDGMQNDGGDEGDLIQNTEEKEENQETILPEIAPEDIINSDDNTDMETKKSPQPMANADRYKVNPLLENIIFENVRSDTYDFEIKTPKNDATFYIKNSIINFNLRGQSSTYKNIEIVIYDNKESSFSNNQYILSTTKEIKDDNFSVSLNIELEKGLYYYVIQEKQTVTFLHTSKFYVK